MVDSLSDVELEKQYNGIALKLSKVMAANCCVYDYRYL